MRRMVAEWKKRLEVECVSQPVPKLYQPYYSNAVPTRVALTSAAVFEHSLNQTTGSLRRTTLMNRLYVGISTSMRSLKSNYRKESDPIVFQTLVENISLGVIHLQQFPNQQTTYERSSRRSPLKSEVSSK